MAKKQIELNVKFEAVIRSEDEHVPVTEVFAENGITLLMPVMDTKYAVFPKILEGVTERVIDELNAQYGAWLQKKHEEEKRKKEEASYMWNQLPIADEQPK
jgi:predicted RNase H-like nuclease (RuvC/YqgF family)